MQYKQIDCAKWAFHYFILERFQHQQAQYIWNMILRNIQTCALRGFIYVNGMSFSSISTTLKTRLTEYDGYDPVTMIHDDASYPNPSFNYKKHERASSSKGQRTC